MPEGDVPNESHEVLLDEVARQAPGALDRLLAAHRRELFDYVRLRLDRELSARLDPSDVVQEVQMTVAQRIDDYLLRRPMPFSIWLRKTALERLINLRKHENRARRTPQAESVLPDQTSLALMKSLVDPGHGPSQRMAAAEMSNAVQSAFAELADADREILLMRQLEGSRFSEIALVLEIDPAAARKRFGRALLKLKDALNRRGMLE